MSVAATRAQVNQPLFALGVSRRAVTVAVSTPGGSSSTTSFTPWGQQPCRLSVSSRDGRATDPDVPVEQQSCPPHAGAGELVEDRADDRVCTTVSCKADRDGGQVDAEGEHASPRERVQVAAGPAADVEHRTVERL